MSGPVIPIPTRKPIRALLIDILVQAMSLDQTIPQAVIYNQQWRMPRDPGLHLHLAYLHPKPFAVTTSYSQCADGGLKEEVTVNKSQTYQLDLYSKDESALDAVDAASAAFMSTFAEQVMEENDFQIARVPLSFVDTSEIDGEGILTRFTSTFNVTSARTFSSPVSYWDQISKEDSFIITQP